MTVVTHTRLDLRRVIAVALAAMLLLGVAALPAAANDPMPSTNEANKAKGWAHFNVDDIRLGAVDLTLVGPRNFLSCFEYRVNGESSPYPTTNNPNPSIKDGMWRYSCVRNATVPLTLAGTAWVDVRMVFGAESVERFDWTRVYIAPTLFDKLVAAGGITAGLEAKVRNALANAEAWLAIPGKEGVALSHYDRAIHLLLWQADVVDSGKPNQGDAAGLRGLATAIEALRNSYL